MSSSRAALTPRGHNLSDTASLSMEMAGILSQAPCRGRCAVHSRRSRNRENGSSVCLQLSRALRWHKVASSESHWQRTHMRLL